MKLDKLLILLLLPLALASCHKVTVVVEGVPENTPATSPLFVGGNFNFWDAADRSFQLKRLDSTRYSIDLPVGWGMVAYKFTRGDWTSVETDPCGHEIPNRLVNFFGSDTIRQRIESWKDLGPTHCPKVVIRLKRLPKETPVRDDVFLAGNFNNWNERDEKFQLKPNSKGDLLYTIAEASGPLEFKFTRGSWAKEEADPYGNKIENRQCMPGTVDTVDVRIDGWVDIDPGDEARRVTFKVHVPPTTPKQDTLFLVGTFNNWKPHDLRYMMKRTGQFVYTITLNKPRGKMEYKVTRGSWKREEVDSYGVPVKNHVLRTLNDTVDVNVIRWSDDPVVMMPKQGVAPYPLDPGNPPDAPMTPTEEVARNMKYIQLGAEAKSREIQKKQMEIFPKMEEAARNLDAALKANDRARISRAEQDLKDLEKRYEKELKMKAPPSPPQSPSADKMKIGVNANVNADIDLRHGEKPVTFHIRNKTMGTYRLFLRAELPGGPKKESFRIEERVEPGKTRSVTAPDGTRLYILQGPGEGKGKPSERFFREITTKDQDHTFDARELDWKQ